MASRRWKPISCRVVIIALVLVIGSVVQGAEGVGAPSNDAGLVALPANERLSYRVSWAGIHCGEMEITSFREPGGGDGGDIHRIVVLIRSTKFFDGIYRVRSRLDSFFDPLLESSVRYEEQSHEKKKRKNDVWLVDHDAGEVLRTKNGETSRIPFEGTGVLDPLIFIFRLRTIGVEVGTEAVFDLMTSKGAVRTVAGVTKSKKLKTKAGPCDAVAIVPEVRDAMMFSNSGAMVVWVDRKAPHRPCRIDFDLSFGKLVAGLKAVDDTAVGSEIADWETWGE